MKKSVFQSAPARALILSLAVGSLGSYVTMASCTKTAAPPQQQATPSATPTVEKGKGEAPASPTPEERLYAPASKSDVILPPPANNAVPNHRLYAPATKAAVIIPRPQPQPAPTPQPAPAAQQAPAQKAP